MPANDLFSLRGRTALVTGGSRGLGLEIAQGLGETGARVAIAARRKEWLDEAQRSLRALEIEAMARAHHQHHFRGGTGRRAP